MVALADPINGFLRGGKLSHADALLTAHYFALFALSLALWSAQGIYARAFYAARNTLTPAISGTLVTCISIPVYALLFHRIGVSGLAIASDIGIFAHTVALAVLLHRYRLVSLASLNYAELTRALAASTGFRCSRLRALHPRPPKPHRRLRSAHRWNRCLAHRRRSTLLATGSKLPAQSSAAVDAYPIWATMSYG